MVFDPNPHLFRMLIIKCGKLVFPQEKNIAVLNEKMSAILGVAPFKLTTKTSGFDANYQLMRQVVIMAGAKLREARGLPPEEDQEKLFNDTSEELGMAKIEPELPHSHDVGAATSVNRLPAPHEMKDDKGDFIVPRKDCPSCGEKESMILGPLCATCEDAKGEDGRPGTYKSMWQCEKCKVKERLTKHLTAVLNEMGVDFGTGTKQSMGIKTYTNEGMK